jgi:2-polyprenyl-3-methyl-5-hydroxy-6-metoxy-1,4-benzoquinol methylase
MTNTNEDNVTFRGWEYSESGDFHEKPDPNWCYTPTYLKKNKICDQFVFNFSETSRILDAGCGEGVFVKKYLKRGYNISGIDLNYESDYVSRGDITQLAHPPDTFDAVLCLDVLEHLTFPDQTKVLQQFHKILRNDGKLLISVPNLSHIGSRFHFFFRGDLKRTDCEYNHISERPYREWIALIDENGFSINKSTGVTLSFPILYGILICKNPSKYLWLHNFLDNFAIPRLAMYNFFECRKG